MVTWSCHHWYHFHSIWLESASGWPVSLQQRWYEVVVIDTIFTTSGLKVHLDGPYHSNNGDMKSSWLNADYKHEHYHHVLVDQPNVASPAIIEHEQHVKKHTISETCPVLPTDVQWDFQYPIVPLGDWNKLFSSQIITTALLPILLYH